VTLLEDVRTVQMGDPAGPRSRRAAVLTNLADSFAAYVDEHRGCDALAAAIVEAEQRDAKWAVAWMVCAGCGVRWERHLKLHA